MTTRYLKNRETGNIFMYTDELAELPFMKEVDIGTVFADVVEVKEIPNADAEAAVVAAKSRARAKVEARAE